MSGLEHETQLGPPSPSEVRFLISDVLKRVSRSFYITLRVLPGPLRTPVGLAYLMARAADTIADTHVMKLDQRLDQLVRFRGMFNGALDPSKIHEIRSAVLKNDHLPAERMLIENIDRCFGLYYSLDSGDRERIAELLRILTTGMEQDLRRFPSHSASDVRSLETPEELDGYTYLVAGCVGPFWTRMSHAHLASLAGWQIEEQCSLGIRFGKALQLTNILRDVSRDIRTGRCYLPSSQLAEIGLAPPDLLDPGKADQLRPLYNAWLDTAHDHYLAAWQYTLAIPRRESRLRLACIWPIWIGLRTLSLLRHNRDFLNPNRSLKISRGEVYRLLAESILKVGADGMLTGRFKKLLESAQ
jgi:farnesyl-diphosphate farnesyltransferase